MGPIEARLPLKDIDEGRNQRFEDRGVGLLHIEDLVEVVPQFNGRSKSQTNIYVKPLKRVAGKKWRRWFTYTAICKPLRIILNIGIRHRDARGPVPGPGDAEHLAGFRWLVRPSLRQPVMFDLS